MGCIKRRICLDCGAPHHILVTERHGVMSQDNADIDDLSCPKCHGLRFEEHHSDGAPPRDEVVNGRTMFPYFDWNLGVTFESAAAKRRYLKAHGLVEMEGEMEAEVAKQRSAEEKLVAEQAQAYAEYQRDVMSDPDIRAAQARFDRISATTTDPEEVRRQFYGR